MIQPVHSNNTKRLEEQNRTQRRKELKTRGLSGERSHDLPRTEAEQELEGPHPSDFRRQPEEEEEEAEREG